MIRAFTPLLILIPSLAVSAGIVASGPPFSLSIEELADWRVEGKLADADNVSRVPLAERFTDARSQLNPRLSAEPRVLLAPDGMNNFGNYLTEQPRFNLYTFTHWAYVDVLNWFAGTATQTVNLPSRPWVEAAHRNGVKVIGTVFFAPLAWGGDVKTPARLLVQTDDGRFPLAHRLVDIAEYYGFDGWLMNQETNLAGPRDRHGRLIPETADRRYARDTAQKYVEFMAYLMRIKPEWMEIHWYDSMLDDGRVAWQNELNDGNLSFLQHGAESTANGMFLNYWWNADMIESSVRLARRVGRSPYDVFAGADLWPGRENQSMLTNTTWLSALYRDGDAGLVSSIALFANNFNYQAADGARPFGYFKDEESDVDRYYEAARRLFIGADRNVAVADGNGAWSGIGRYVPARSVIRSLPFTTSFNTGHGRIKATGGIERRLAWYDMAAQDLLPSWQFATIGNPSTLLWFDFSTAYEGGNSLAIRSNLGQGATDVPLYKTQLELPADDAGMTIRVTSKATVVGEAVSLWLEFDHDERVSFPLPSAREWTTKRFSLAPHTGRTVTRIGLALGAAADGDVTVHVGSLSIQ